MAQSLLIEPVQSYEDSNGKPLNGGQLFTYDAGTLTPKATYQDSAGTIPNANPIILNERGEATVYGSGNYRLILKNSVGATIWDRDNVSTPATLDELAGPNGAALIGYDDSTLNVFLKSRINRVVDSIAALRGLDKTKYTRAIVTGYYAPADGGGGLYWMDSGDTTSADNGGSIIVGSDGGRWKLVRKGAISVKQFGAKGDGTTDDSATIQATFTSLAILGGGIYFPAGDYKIVTPIDMPAVNLDVFGDGNKSRLFGSAAALLKYPASVTDGGGNIVVQNLQSLMFEQTGDGIGVQMTQTWTSAGKVGPSVRNCYFLNSSTTTTTATCLHVSGTWAAKIHDNTFKGLGNGGGPTNGIGGYGIKVALGADMNTSVMNLTVLGNIFVQISKQFFVENRSGDGRAEGFKIVGNNFIAGEFAIRLAQTLATTVSGNQMSDFYEAVKSFADFDLTITGNSEITGSNSGINIVAAAFGLAERISIAGNSIVTGANGVCVRLTNLISNDIVRSIAVVGNALAGPAGNTSVGVSLEGTNTINGLNVTGNVFNTLLTGLSVSNIAHADIKYDANNYYLVTNKILDPGLIAVKNKLVFSQTIVKALAGGGATEIVNISVPTGYFDSKPGAAFMAGPVGLITGYYDYDASTTTTLVFNVRRADGASIGAGNYRFSVSAFGVDY